ncbi:hypothetical protein HFO55_12980 [Rhizobium leguminosarum]|uniref:hypothetical protein n=1 Tax=Rhizobium leguminosarum TaxID=384 RepID=UPI001C96F3FC|nr:hypothetical protein [Rhizobium leguminosarum]MBY5568145.1 hypothetical protein [Rhizobium leguminosarum]MBY5568151.1 hypothetical protein [Rhizobium leguminosarum]MBY5575280.1 hypothetical protein [Rhizobium leguminosarum]MBY5575286.1 hypothetical protein [Rhizobium leguminosarum]
MQRINMLQGYSRLAAATGAIFIQPVDNADQSRLVKFRIITEQDVVLKVSDCVFDPETGEVSELTNTRLLTVVKAGFDEVEFYYLGTFSLDFMGPAEIWLDTFDSAFVSTEATDFTNYARLWEREERDPRILEIERAARHNQTLLQQQMAEDFARYAASLEAKYAKPAAPVDGSGGTTSVEPVVPAVTPPANPPAETTAPAGTGGEQNVPA